MDEFNSYDNYINYCGQESLRRNGVSVIVNKSPKCSTWVQYQKWQKDNCSFPRQITNITVIQVCVPISNAEEAEQFYEDLQDLLELTSKKDILFIIGRKSRKSRNTWSNRQIWPWSTEWSGAKTNRVLPRECTGHSKHPLATTQEKTLHMDMTRWSILKSDWLNSLQPQM